MLKQFGVSTNEIYQEDFLKVALSNPSTKAAIAGSESTISIVFYQLKASKIEMLKLVKFISKTFWKKLFEPALRKQ